MSKQRWLGIISLVVLCGPQINHWDGILAEKKHYLSTIT